MRIPSSETPVALPPSAARLSACGSHVRGTGDSTAQPFLCSLDIVQALSRARERERFSSISLEQVDSDLESKYLRRPTSSLRFSTESAGTGEFLLSKNLWSADRREGDMEGKTRGEMKRLEGVMLKGEHRRRS